MYVYVCAVGFFFYGGGGVSQQVALHRSLTSLLHVAEMRPVNWRRYCATSSSLSSVPRVEADSAARAGSSVEEQRCSGEGALLAQFGTLPPVCVLFALCENGSRSGAGASELQPLIWQLLELTLRPEDDDPTRVGGGALPLPPPAHESLLRKGGSVDGGNSIGVDNSKPPPQTHEGEGSAAGTSSSVDGANVGARLIGVAGQEGGLPPVPSSSVRSRSPAELLMAKGLVGSDALVEMTQDLLSPVASVEARKRKSRVLRHLWAASAADSRLEVREGQKYKGLVRSVFLS